MSPRLTHLAFHVDDLSACVSFYAAYCGLRVVHERGEGDERVVWLGEADRAKDFVLVLIAGGVRREQAADDYGHLGFALSSREAVEDVARRAASEGLLVWPVRDAPFPVGTYCGVRAPDGRVVEFSHGQPLGPGADFGWAEPERPAS
ncbi:MAG: VOC family protein [Planctomycetota bacterium]|nr:MAG: VOC family protein [Planctomycetota bacterium]